MDIKFDQRGFDINLITVGDLVDIEITENSEDDLMQRLFLRLKTYPRDLFWNVRYGIDYLNSVFGKNRPINSVDIIIRDEILKEPLVNKITYFESEIVNYSYACKFTVSIINEVEQVTFYILTNENGVILTDNDGNTLTSRL